MRTSTVVVLFLLALALAIWGWRFVGWVVIAILLIPLLLILLGFVAVLVLRAKIKRDVRRFLTSFGRAARGPARDERIGGASGPAGRPPGARPGVIDVEARDATSTPAGGHGRGNDERR